MANESQPKFVAGPAPSGSVPGVRADPVIVNIDRGECSAHASSLVIVPVPSASLIVAPNAFDRWTVNASFGSNVVSPLTKTVNCLVVSALRKLTVVVGIAVKSDGAVAVPSTVA